MRDLLVLIAFVAAITAFLAIGCGTASAQTGSSPNYEIQYLDENSPPSSGVQGESNDVQFQEPPAQPAQTNELPATNPPYVLIGTIVAGIAIAVIVYIALK